MSRASAPLAGRPGLGVDVVDVAALARRLDAQPALAELLFTPEERAAAARARRPVQLLAACFAAKEAFVKALGRGFTASGPDAWLQQVAVRLDDAGAPALSLGAAPARAVERRGLGAPRLTLACAGERALASVLLLPESATPARSTA